ncbi:phospholipase D family protein [Dyella sp. KULCS107]|uniref:phospholipase D family protein n=1 Tax=Dyella sp. KULCS107 TaxID=3422216 RepID=UPI003D6F5669
MSTRWRHLAPGLLAMLALSGCATLRKDFPKPQTTALPPKLDTPSARYVHREVASHDEQSGFRLLTFSTNALMSRVTLADHAKHTLDLQYYIFANDATGRLVAQRLLAAADRGVRVRLLLDDINIDKQLDMLDALDSHPNIEVRLFNPFGTRARSGLVKATQFVLDGSRLNHRMHNKSFIADNTVAIVGGRNIGDDYFDAGESTHFRDLDLIAIGPVVRQASQAFDEYWNCDAAYPVKAFSGKHPGHLELATLRQQLAHDARQFAQSDYAQATLEQLPHGPSGDRPGKWFWGHATLVADQPAKIDADGDDPSLRIGPDIKAMLDGAQHHVQMISPYFIPGDDGTAFLTGLAKRGVRVQVLTNSLASTDEPAVHAGYSRYRLPLLRGGVQLYELRPAPGAKQPATDAGKSSGVSLHAKAIVVDAHEVFIGSMNMDERSKLLNTEMGIIVDNAPLAEAVERYFDDASRPTSAWRVMLDPTKPAADAGLRWQGDEGGQLVTHDSDPDATAGRKAEVGLIKLLPVESLL